MNRNYLQRTEYLRHLAETITDFTHDGKTVYCWRSSLDNIKSLDAAPLNKILASGVGESQCAVSLNLNIPTTIISTTDGLDVEWTAKVLQDDLPSNAIQFNQVSDILDPISNQSKIQILHSNLHICKFGEEDCSPFGKDGKKTVVQSGNFSDRSASFIATEKLDFSNPGSYSVMTHLVLPGPSTTSSKTRFDFATFTRVDVTDERLSRGGGSMTAPPDNTGDTNEFGVVNNGKSDSTGVVLAVVIIGSLLVIGLGIACIFFLARKQRKEFQPQDGDEDSSNVPEIVGEEGLSFSAASDTEQNDGRVALHRNNRSSSDASANEISLLTNHPNSWTTPLQEDVQESAAIIYQKPKRRRHSVATEDPFSSLD